MQPAKIEIMFEQYPPKEFMCICQSHGVNYCIFHSKKTVTDGPHNILPVLFEVKDARETNSI